MCIGIRMLRVPLAPGGLIDCGLAVDNKQAMPGGATPHRPFFRELHRTRHTGR